VLATQLERTGYAAQRFDFFGTGDSGGEGDDLDVAACLADIELAAAELIRLSGVTRLVLVGLRLGASLAALAAERLCPRHLVLWDPVVDGASYLRELAVAHRTFMKDELGEVAWRDLLRVDSNGVPDEALGTAITPALAAGIAAIDLAKALPRADQVTVISTRESPGTARLRQRWCTSSGVRWLDMPASVAWNSDAALNNATVPIDIVQAIVARIEELSP
jgi:pimeloyl-ACP methyl ester carboxylesterase